MNPLWKSRASSYLAQSITIVMQRGNAASILAQLTAKAKCYQFYLVLVFKLCIVQIQFEMSLRYSAVVPLDGVKRFLNWCLNHGVMWRLCTKYDDVIVNSSFDSVVFEKLYIFTLPIYTFHNKSYIFFRKLQLPLKFICSYHVYKYIILMN